MNKFKYFLIGLLVLFSGELLAQSVLSGRVYEMINGQKEPAIAVNVVVANSQNRFLAGVTTGMNGEYNLRIPAGESDLNIIFSFVGMKTQTIKYTGQTILDVTLEADQQLLDEVNVTAQRVDRNILGISEKQQTTATQKVNLSEIMETSPVTSIEEALQGQLGGVDIVLGGDPGSKSSIRIRGTSSLNTSSEPLIVIDGIPYSTDIDDDFDFATANEEDFGALLNISPSDIQEIEVLKDAASTAIWGTKGANGVLMITTKKGSKGKTNFSFSSKMTVKFEPKSIPMLDGNQYVALMQDAIWNTANAIGTQSSAYLLQLLFDTPEINYQPDWRYFNEYNQNTDWLSEIRKNAVVTDNNFAMAGGGDKATYRFSLGYTSEPGTTIGTGMNRLTSRLNVNYQFSDRFRVDAEMFYSYTEREDSWTGSGNTRSEALRKMPNKSPYWIDPITGERTNNYFVRQVADEFQGAFRKSGSSYYNFNPVAMVKESFNNTTQRESGVNIRLNYFITPEITYNGYVSMQLRGVKNKKFLPQQATGVMFTNEYANQSSDLMSDVLTIQTENKLLYNKRFNVNHSLVLAGIFRTSQTTTSNYKSVTYGNASPGLSDPSTGAAVSEMGSGRAEYRSVTALMNAHYTFLNRYIVQGTLNYEGNSSMGGDNRWGLFPAVGVAWWIHEESFLREKEWLDLAKIRFSYGQSGSSPSGASPYVGTYSALNENYVTIGAIAPKTVQLNKLKWQTAEEFNIGFDLTLLTGKFNFTFDWYHKTIDDLLQKDVKVPSSTGFSKIAWYNSGSMTNKGIEFRADYEVFRNKDWRITLNANVSRNINEIVSLPENLNEDDYTFGNGNYAKKLEKGTPVGSFFGYKYLGVYQNTNETYARDANGKIMTNMAGNNIVMKNGTYTTYPGDARYADLNYDGVIDEYDIAYIGNGMPVVTGGGGFNVKYKTITLLATFHGRFGQKLINKTRMNNEAMYNEDNQSTAVLKRWRSEGDDTDIPRALYDYGNNYLGSDRFVENASYLRLQSLSLSYGLPKKIVQRWGITNMSFFITGYDLITWTKYTGQDPEVSLPSKATDLLYDNATTPRAKRFAVGLNLNF